MKIMTKIFAMVLSIGVLILIGIVTQSFFQKPIIAHMVQ